MRHPCLTTCCHCDADMRADVQAIFKLTPHEKQVMMFSATLNAEMRAICKKFMSNVRVLDGECLSLFTCQALPAQGACDYLSHQGQFRCHSRHGKISTARSSLQLLLRKFSEKSIGTSWADVLLRQTSHLALMRRRWSCQASFHTGGWACSTSLGLAR